MAEPGSTFEPFPPGTPELGQTWGAFLIGTAIGVFLNVFSLILGCKYFQLYPTDALFLRCIVLIVLPLDLFQTIVNVHACYWHLVRNHSNPLAVAQEHWSFIAFGTVSIWTIVVCQIFYAHRVFRLASYYRWVALLAVIGMGISTGFDIALLVDCIIAPNLFALRAKTWLVTGIYGSILFTDVILTCALVFMLVSKRTGQRLSRTDTVIASIITYTVSSGLLFTIISTIGFLFTLIQRGNIIFCALMAFGVKVYVMSMLTAIILRKAFAVRMRSDDPLPTTTCGMKKRGEDRNHRAQVMPSTSGVSSIAFAPMSSPSQSGMDSTTVTGQAISWNTSDSTERATVSD